MKNASSRAGRPVSPMNGYEVDYYLVGRAYSASGRMTKGGFVVYAGAVIAPSTRKLVKERCYANRRRRMMDDGTIVKDAAGRDVLTRAYTFPSHTMAAIIVSGRIMDGLSAWRVSREDYRKAATYGDNHSAAVVKTAELPAECDRATMESDALIDGRAWHHEWRGQTPVHKGGVYLGARCV